MDEIIGFGLSQSCGNRGVLDVCVFELRWCRWGMGWWLGPGCGGWVVLCLCEL